MDSRPAAADNNNKVAAVLTSLPPRLYQQLRYHDMFFRILALLLTLVAVIVVAVDKQTKTIPITLSDSMPPLQIHVTAKWHYLSSNVYFLVVNAIAFSYAAGTLLYALAIRAKKQKDGGVGYLVIIILDVVIMGLLFSANGALAGVGIIGQFGNSHTRWSRVCNVFGQFCHDMIAALAASLLASFVFLWMVAMALFNLHKMIKLSNQI